MSGIEDAELETTIEDINSHRKAEILRIREENEVYFYATFPGSPLDEIPTGGIAGENLDDVIARARALLASFSTKDSGD